MAKGKGGRTGFVTDRRLSSGLEGWEIGSIRPGSSHDQDYLVPIESPAALDTVNGHLYYLKGLVAHKAPDDVAKVEPIIILKSGQGHSTLESLPEAVKQALLEKTRALETENGLTGFHAFVTNQLKVATPQLAENVKLESEQFITQAARVEIEGIIKQNWIVAPIFFMNADNEIFYGPSATLIRRNGRPDAQSQYGIVPQQEDERKASDYTVIIGGDRSLAPVPYPVRQALAGLMSEMAGLYDVPVDPVAYERVKDTHIAADTEETRQRIDIMARTSVTPTPPVRALSLSAQVETTGIDQAKENENVSIWSVRTVMTHSDKGAQFAVRPVIVNLETGESYSCKARETQPLRIGTKNMREVTDIVIERITPDAAEEISFLEFCDKVPQTVRAMMGREYQGIAVHASLRLSDAVKAGFSEGMGAMLAHKVQAKEAAVQDDGDIEIAVASLDSDRHLEGIMNILRSQPDKGRHDPIRSDLEKFMTLNAALQIPDVNIRTPADLKRAQQEFEDRYHKDPQGRQQAIDAARVAANVENFFRSGGKASDTGKQR